MNNCEVRERSTGHKRVGLPEETGVPEGAPDVSLLGGPGVLEDFPTGVSGQACLIPNRYLEAVNVGKWLLLC